MKLEEILTEIIQSAQTAKDFVIDQAPDVIQQLLAWHFWFHAAFVLILSVIMILAFFTARWFNLKRIAAKERCKSADNYELCIGFSIVAVIVSFVFVVYNAIMMLKIYIAPKLYLLEYAASLITGNK
jgi:uncharacterized membrane protein YidH (DUF202 family)